MKTFGYLKIVVATLLLFSNSLYADHQGTLGTTSKASVTITLTIPAHAFQNKSKSFDFNYDEPYQMTSFLGGYYKVLKRCIGQSSCVPDSTARVIIFEPL